MDAHMPEQYGTSDARCIEFRIKQQFCSRKMVMNMLSMMVTSEPRRCARGESSSPAGAHADEERSYTTILLTYKPLIFFSCQNCSSGSIM